MIEQTPLVVNEWIYIPPGDGSDSGEEISSKISLDVMKKSAPTKKGIACRFTCKFFIGSKTLLLYVAEDSYVIDLNDIIDKSELLTMIRNSFSKFKAEFDMRRSDTILQNKSLKPLDESLIDLNAILTLLN